MTPAFFNSDNEQKVIGTIAMLTAGVIESKVAAVIAGIPEDALYKTMAMPVVQAAVDVEITRLRLQDLPPFMASSLCMPLKVLLKKKCHPIINPLIFNFSNTVAAT